MESDDPFPDLGREPKKIRYNDEVRLRDLESAAETARTKAATWVAQADQYRVAKESAMADFQQAAVRVGEATTHSTYADCEAAKATMAAKMAQNVLDAARASLKLKTELRDLKAHLAAMQTENEQMQLTIENMNLQHGRLVDEYSELLEDLQGMIEKEGADIDEGNAVEERQREIEDKQTCVDVPMSTCGRVLIPLSCDWI